ncbi:MAG TPA: zinc ribbon domain-containing protein [Gemmatimonadaceae bacterium]|nr:zinc ribbon domain-containing protein [Gemmatimonadaceae bacterium]
MALIHCPECRHEVSDRAAACPNCGYALGGSHVPAVLRTETVTVERNKHPFLTFIGTAVVALFLIGVVHELATNADSGVTPSAGLASAAPPLPLAPPAPPPPTARFTVVDVLVDEECSQLFEYCLQGHCIVQNAGDAAGQRRVKADLLLRDSRQVVATHWSNLTLLPGGSERLTFRFDEALIDSTYTVRCRLEPGPGRT